MGCYFGARLAEAGLPVGLYEHDRGKAVQLARQGFTIFEQDGSSRVVRVPVYCCIEDGPAPGLIIVLVKSYDTDSAASDIARIYSLQSRPLVLTLQNGLDNLEKLAAMLGSERLLGGVTYEAAYEQEPGIILHAGSGNTYIAPLDETATDAASLCAALLAVSGLQALASTAAELELLRWYKLLVNASINPLSAIYRLKNGELAENEQVRGEMMELAREAVTVAEAQGINLDFASVWQMILDTCNKTAANHSSMLSDLERGRKTEIDAINGSIVALAKAAGIATPAQERVLGLVRHLTARTSE